jgi:phage terminase small subunit
MSSTVAQRAHGAPSATNGHNAQDAPPHLTARETLHWRRYHTLLGRNYHDRDAAALEQLASFSAQLEELMELRRKGGVQSHFVKTVGKNNNEHFAASPLMAEIRATSQHVTRLLHEFGLTPDGRASLSTGAASFSRTGF